MVRKILDSHIEEIVRSTNIANTMNECLWVGDKSHKTIYVNPVFEKTSEYSLDECLGKDCVFFFNKEGKKTISEHHKLRPKGLSSQYEATMISKSGKKIPLLISGSPTKNGGTMGIFTNLSKLKELDEEKRISEQIIRNSTEAIVVLNQNRKIKMWNTGAKKMFGYKENDVLNKSIDIIIPKEEKESNKDLLSYVEKNKYLKNVETKRQAKNGSIIDVNLTITKVTDIDKKFIGYLVIYRDITQQKQVNTELQKRFETIQDAYKELGLQKRRNDYLYEIIDTAVLKSSNLQNLAQLIVSASCLLTKCDGSVLRTFDPKRNHLSLIACLGTSNKWLDKSKIAFKNSIAEDAFKNKRPIIIQDVESYPKHRGTRLVKAHNFKTLILIPLMIEDKLLGSLSIYSKDPGKLRLIETDFLERFGKQCSSALFVKLHKK